MFLAATKQPQVFCHHVAWENLEECNQKIWAIKDSHMWPK